MKKIAVYTNHYQPENFKINEIVDYLSSKNSVEVITQIPNYPQGDFYKGFGYFKKRKEVRGNITISRWAVIPRKQNKITLALNYMSYYLSSFFRSLIKRYSKTDLVFIYITSPIFISLAAIRHAKKQNAPKVMYLLDLWPDNLFSIVNIKNRWIRARIIKMCERIYKNMDVILISSLMFKETLLELGVEPDKIIYYPQHVHVKEIERNRLKSKITKILFAGNIGEAQGLSLLVDLAKVLKEKQCDTIHFELLGDGRYKKQLMSDVMDKGLNDYFTFYDAVSADKVSEYYLQSDLGLVILKDDETISKHLPAKVQGYMAHKVPILAFASGEVKRVIEESNSGIVIEYNEIEKMVTQLMSISDLTNNDYQTMSENGYRHASEKFSYELQMNQLDKLLNQLIHSREE